MIIVCACWTTRMPLADDRDRDQRDHRGTISAADVVHA